MFKVISQDTLLEQRRKLDIEEQVPFITNGETDYVTKKMVNGEMETLELEKPLGEMMSFGSTAIYDAIRDANLPQVLDANWALYGNCVFLEHMEGG